MLSRTTIAALAPGRGAVITGGASGIGLATARQLAVFGMRVCIADRDRDALSSNRVQKPPPVGEKGQQWREPAQVFASEFCGEAWR